MSKSALAVALKLQGYTYDQIGKQLGFSRQYAQQLVRPPRGIYKLIKDRANGACEDCGEPAQNGHVHHKSNVENFNDVENLSYLCISCHRTAHIQDDSLRKGTRIFSLRLPLRLYEHIKDLAKGQRSVNAQVILLLKKGLLERAIKAND